MFKNWNKYDIQINSCDANIFLLLMLRMAKERFACRKREGAGETIKEALLCIWSEGMGLWADKCGVKKET